MKNIIFIFTIVFLYFFKTEAGTGKVKSIVTLNQLNETAFKNLLKTNDCGYKIINFWSVKCIGCKFKLHDLAHFSHVLKENDLQLISVNTDGINYKTKSAKYLNKFKIQGDHYFINESESELLKNLGLQFEDEIPHIIVIGPEGNVVFAIDEEGSVSELFENLKHKMGKNLLSENWWN